MNGYYTAADLVKELQGLSARVEERNSVFASAHQSAANDLRGSVQQLLQSDDDTRTREIAASLWRSTENLDVVLDNRKRAAEAIKEYVAAHFPNAGGSGSSPVIVSRQPDEPLGYLGVMAAAARAEGIAAALKAAALIHGSEEDISAAREAEKFADALQEQAQVARVAAREARKFDWESLVDIGFVVAGLVLPLIPGVGLPTSIGIIAAKLVWKSYKASRWHSDGRARLRALRKPTKEAWKELKWEIAREYAGKMLEAVPGVIGDYVGDIPGMIGDFVGVFPAGVALVHVMKSAAYISSIKELGDIWHKHRKHHSYS